VGMENGIQGEYGSSRKKSQLGDGDESRVEEWGSEQATTKEGGNPAFAADLRRRRGGHCIIPRRGDDKLIGRKTPHK